MRTSMIIASTLFVGAAGVIAVSLFAPGKGSKARNTIARKGKLYKDYLIDNLYDFADSISHTFENMEDKTIHLSKKTNAKAIMIKTE